MYVYVKKDGVISKKKVGYNPGGVLALSYLDAATQSGSSFFTYNSKHAFNAGSGSIPSLSSLSSTMQLSNTTKSGFFSASYSTSVDSSNIYRTPMLSKIYSLSDPIVEISGFGSDYATICDSDGNSLSINIELGVSATAVVNSFELSFSDKWSGSWTDMQADNLPPFDNALLRIFLIQTNPAEISVVFTCDYRNSSDNPETCLVRACAIDYPDTSLSVIYNILSMSDGIYGAAGTLPSDTEGEGDTGGDGDYDFPSTDIDPDDDLDSSSSGASPAISAGLVNPYYVTASEIAALGNFLWSNSFYDSIAKTFSNPMDCIISLASFPVTSSSMSLGSSESVRVGNTTSSSTGTRLISEFVTIDCGSVSVPEVWGSYLDYAQTKLYIYIPYLGIEELPLCECMGGSVACKLRINLLTGALVACLTLTSGTYVTGSARKQPIYFSTTCKSDIPVSGATTGALAGAFQLLGGAVSTVAGIASGTAPVAVAGLASAAQGVATMQSQNSQISGAVGAAGGQMAHKIPFLIFDRPVQSVPANLANVAGYQSNSGTTLSRCSGYVICDTINLDGLALTRSELEEVEQICTSGVYIS